MAPTAGAGATLVIRTPDGKSRTVPLPDTRLTLGRATTNDLCYADDAGLSRQHLVFERAGREWQVKDVGSKNGTLVNGFRITGAATLKPGDRVSAGHLTMEFAGAVPTVNDTVVFVEGQEIQTTATTTVATSLEGLMGRDESSEDMGKTRVFQGSPQTTSADTSRP